MSVYQLVGGPSCGLAVSYPEGGMPSLVQEAEWIPEIDGEPPTDPPPVGTYRLNDSCYVWEGWR